MFAACCGVGMSLFWWLLVLISFHQPLAAVRSVVAFFGFVPVYLASHVGSDVHASWSMAQVLFWMLIFTQWFTVGLGLSFLFRGLRGHSDAA